MIRVRIRSTNKYGWLGEECKKYELSFHIVTDDGVNLFCWPASDIERIYYYFSENG